ncbi:amino acid ABC transporter ATP-binding protein [Bacillus solimangrovi]|uniref:Polar amino acid ABC transporter ATP-binding protein n=1 Tax=Bacillus solimangrovi TaxID=1305675 RepID=A0A1E5LFS6_9BACI|nr:amino acid ABC transporter ATP-binding protein [Bacillus solimangrovi]OEH92938.1 polar amino acid ABC transporter ATP-binding protein [Bacillus solimangrovi]
MISIEGLSKKFGDNEVLRSIDFNVGKGEVVCLIGPSGSGKTTLLRCLNLLEDPTKGKITVGDVSLTFSNRAASKKDKEAIRQYSGMVFQHFHLFPHKTVIENLIEAPLVVQKRNKTQLIEEAERLLEKVGLTSQRDQYPDELSGGQKQRAAIARMLMMKPEVLLFDEPTSALDPELIGEVLSVIKDLASEGQTMIIVTHEMAFARDVADRVVFMADGYVVEDAHPEVMFTAPKEARTRQFLSKMINQ